MEQADDLDVDCELVIIDIDEDPVRAPPLQTDKPRVVRTRILPDQRSEKTEPGPQERLENSPNGTESDSGFFTSSHSKYSLESLQEESRDAVPPRNTENKNKEEIRHQNTRKEVVPHSENILTVQALPEVELRQGSDEEKRGTSQPPIPVQFYQASVKLSSSLPATFTRSRTEKSRAGFHSLSDQTNRDMTTSTNTFRSIIFKTCYRGLENSYSTNP